MRYTQRTLIFAGALIVVCGASTPARAQPTPPAPTAQTAQTSNIDEARARFEEGVAAMQRREWQPAFDALEASMRLRRSASVALNLGVVLRELHRYVEARVRLQEFMDLASPQQHQQNDAEVARLLSDSVRRLATLRVPELAPATADITVDGRRVQLNPAGEATLDPGPHTVRAEAAGFAPFEERIDFAESQTRDLRIALVAQPAAPVATQSQGPHPAVAQPADPRVAPTHTAQSESRPFYTRWWFWTAVAVVAAGGVTAGVVAASSGTRAFPMTSTNRVIQAEVTP